MRKLTACLLVLLLSFLGCTSVAKVVCVRGDHFPTQGEGMVIGIKVGSDSDMVQEVVSVDQDIELPVQTSLEIDVSDEMPIPNAVVIALIISSIVRAINSLPISICEIF